MSALAVEGTNALPFPILTAIVLTPILGAIVIAFIPRSRPDMHRLASVLTAVITAAMSLYMLVQFKAGDPGFQFVVSQTWVSSLDIKFALGVDGISLFLVVLTGIFAVIAFRAFHRFEKIARDRGVIDVVTNY